jgi:hypothetical protein
MSSELEAIKGLLLHEWDPIGVSEFPEASDEYDAYALQVYRWFASTLMRMPLRVI